jgi:hypothetical protein
MNSFQGTIKIDANGRPRIVEKKYWEGWCVENADKQCDIVVKPLGRKSDPLRRYYFGVVVELYRGAFRNLGHNLTKDETHEFIKTLCPSMTSEIVLPTGEVKTRYLSIADKSFTNTHFLAYIEELKQWAAEELDLIIPDPNDFEH